MASSYEQKALVVPSADTSTGTFAEKLCRWANHHGAIFASPGERRMYKKRDYIL
jgi:hypothetical protein